MLRMRRLTTKDRKMVIDLYRECMRVVRQLQPSHQKIWYDYTKLKFAENAHRSPEDIRTLVSSAYEELEWVKSVVQRKNN